MPISIVVILTSLWIYLAVNDIKLSMKRDKEIKRLKRLNDELEKIINRGKREGII